MSFLGGGDASCSAGANPLAQFQKHVQDDKSLQRDRLVGRAPGSAPETFRSRQAGPANPDMMNEFMQHHQQPSLVGNFQMEQMRREFEQLHTGPGPQRQGSPGLAPSGWAGEFDGSNGGSAHGMEMPGQAAQAGFDPAEFQRYVQMKQAGVNGTPQAAGMVNGGYQRPPMQMGYGGMYGNMGYGGGSMGMMHGGGFGMQRPMMGDDMQRSMEDKGKGRMVELDDKDWEAQFAQLDELPQDLDAEAEAAAERELYDLDRVDQLLPDELFESVWTRIRNETSQTGRSRQPPHSRLAAESENTADLLDEWSNFESANLSHAFRDPEVGNYMFEEENMFSSVENPFDEGVRIMDSGGNLSLAALAFEAAVRKDPQHVDAWSRLGAAQAQNEKESAAIRALEQAIKLDPGNLDALMSLAVSYTNEGYDSAAYRTLERWLSAKYPAVAPPAAVGDDLASPDLGFTERAVLHERVTNLFIEAAQLSPDPEHMDPDVQVGLGVLFYGAEEFDKAVDCFSAALASNERGSSNSDVANQRPLLWNRLGATLANSQRSEEAIGAYEKALELNPNFVRARYNLGVSCINIGCYAEAAQHLLGALAMHKVVEKESREKARELLASGTEPGGAGAAAAAAEDQLGRIIRQNQSTNLYDTLRRVFGQMERKDLQEKVVPGVDPDIFRGEFEF